MNSETPAPVFGVDRLEVLHGNVLEQLQSLKDTLEEHDRTKLQGRVDFVGALVELAKRIEQGEIVSAILIVDRGDVMSTQAFPPTAIVTLVGMLELSKDTLLRPERRDTTSQDVVTEPG